MRPRAMRNRIPRRDPRTIGAERRPPRRAAVRSALGGNPRAARPIAASVAIAIATTCLATAGCAINPATGKRELSLVSESSEIRMGQQAHPGILQSFGRYEDDALQTYVSDLGKRLAAKSERPELPWTFTVVDDPVVNAFALPGGYIYITRGILAHFGSEAELVSVLGHEIGHVTARHSASQLSKQQLYGGLFTVGMIASEDLRQYGGVAQQGLGLAFLKFGRDDEREADELGMRYMLRTRHDPREMANVFRTLGRVGDQSGGRMPGWLSTHPAPENRVGASEARVAALGQPLDGMTVDRDGYVARLDGMKYGVDPREGYFEGALFLHPEMAFSLRFPEGWKTANTKSSVAAQSPEGDAIVRLTLAEGTSTAAALAKFFEQEGLVAGASWSESIGGNAVVGRRFSATGQSGTIQGDVGFVPYGGRVFQLTAFATDAAWGSRESALRATMRSFARVTDRAVLDKQPDRLRIVTLDRAMTFQEAFRRWRSKGELDALAVANGVRAGDRLPAGRKIKLVR